MLTNSLHSTIIVKKVCNEIYSAMLDMISSKAYIMLLLILTYYTTYLLPALQVWKTGNFSPIGKNSVLELLPNKTKYNSQTLPLFHSCNILPVEDLILQQKLIFLHPFFYGHTVSYPQFVCNQSKNDHRFTLRNEFDYNVQRELTCQ